MTVNLQQSPYLPRQRNFPVDNAQVLGIELDKAYIEIAQRVNERTIGLFSVNLPSITGESWYLSGQPRKQQTLRQVYQVSSTAPIPHGIIFSQIMGFSRLFGQFTDGTNWYGLIAGSNVPIAGQISFFLTPTNITFLVGAGAPALVSGFVVLEWLSVQQNNNP
jgi:hypothetical protein